MSLDVCTFSNGRVQLGCAFAFQVERGRMSMRMDQGRYDFQSMG